MARMVWRAALAAALMAGPVLSAPVSTTLYTHKHWEVEGIVFEDGTRACLAEVDAGTDSFSVWYYQDGSFRLQFYSTEWSFGEGGDTADLQVRIDRRAPWRLTNADLYRNSVLFNLPGDGTGVRFLVEVAQGNRLHLNTATGEGVKSYSLAGSQASIRALVGCGEQITPASRNPFN
ncbi:MAG TPA: hypothetical protein PKD10_08625 [Paracoccaceae bacterium]|nr:hypothetical protein [Paracoccaceae bacterium]HMO70739.1 hypothetical protein [Paracoccaceae bacterium]